MVVKWNAACSILLIVFLATAAQGQGRKKLIFTNIDDNTTGWGSCTTCAGGANNADFYGMTQFQTTPSRDGSSTQFYISANNPYSDVLFWEKLGAQDWATQFTWDFWVLVDDASVGAQALEYDLFQFISGTEYMFGTQCLYASGQWNIWSQGGRKWVPIPVTCKPFAPNVWHHIVWQFHRTPDTQVYYDSLTLDGTQYVVNLSEPSGP